MKRYQKLFSSVLVAVLSLSVYAHACKIWAPISNGDLFFILPVKPMAHDLDCDGIVDSKDSDMDGDGIANNRDAFPRNPHESRDTDHDGIGDNADRPKAYAQTLNMEDKPRNIKLRGRDNDHSIRYIIVSKPKHGTLTGTAPNMKYVPQAGYEGRDSFSFRVYDGSLYSSVVTVTLNVSPKYIIHYVHNVQQFRQALENAAMNHQHDKIILSQGIYKTTSDSLGTFTYGDDEKYNLTIVGKAGVGRSKIVLDGDGEDTVFIIENTGNGILRLENMTIKNGYNDDSQASSIDAKCHIKIKGVNFFNNKGNTLIYNHAIANSSMEFSSYFSNIYISGNDTIAGIIGGGGGRVDIESSTIKNNKVGYNAVFGSYVNMKNVLLSNNVLFSRNSSTTLIAAWSMSLTDVVMKKNKASTLVDSQSGNQLVSNSLIEENTVDTLFSTFSIGKKDIQKVIIKNNICNREAIETGQGASIIANSIISGNVFKMGFGLNDMHNSIIKNNKFLDTENVLVPGIHSNVLTNNYFYNNEKSGINNQPLVTVGYIVNNTFYKNTSTTYIVNASVVINTIFLENTSPKDAKIKGYLMHSAINPNRIDSEPGYTLKKSGNIQSNASLGLNANGTLKLTSSAINRGLNPSDSSFQKAIAKSTYVNNALKKDLYNHTRIHNGIIDIGATEN